MTTQVLNRDCRAFGKLFCCVLAVMSADRPVTAEPESPKPKVWIYTDMSDRSIPGPNSEGTLNDPDDISAMAGYLLMANEFETLGIVVASTHRAGHRDSPDQAAWADRHLGAAYRAEVAALNQALGGYPPDVRFLESSIKRSAEHYDPQREYRALDQHATVQALLSAALALPPNETLNVLCWGSVTEPAILVNHCLCSDQADLLRRLRFIAHWTNSPLHQGSAEHSEQVANCREDAAACAYLKRQALAGAIVYYECGAIGQHGIVSGGPKGRAYFDRFLASRLGTRFVTGKFVHDGVDHSDAATYWTLLGSWGVGLQDLASDGTNPTAVEAANEQRFREWSPRIHDELLRRSNAAAGADRVDLQRPAS